MSGDQHSPKQMLRHYRQLAGHPILLIFWLACGVVPMLTGIWAAQQRGMFLQPTNKEGKEDNLSQIFSAFWVGFFLGVSFLVVVVVGYFCCYPTPQIQGQSHLFCLVICGITSSFKQEILPMSELARYARKYSNLSAIFINQPSLFKMKYGMESHIQQIQRNKL